MKKLIITIAIMAALACEKEKNQKCYWSAVNGSRVFDAWHSKPSSDQVKKIQDTCSCVVTIEEHCFPCSQSVTDPGGNDVPCQ